MMLTKSPSNLRCKGWGPRWPRI